MTLQIWHCTYLLGTQKVKDESPQCSCAYILTQRYLFPAMVIMTSIAGAPKRSRRFGKQHYIAPEWALC